MTKKPNLPNQANKLCKWVPNRKTSANEAKPRLFSPFYSPFLYKICILYKNAHIFNTGQDFALPRVFGFKIFLLWVIVRILVCTYILFRASKCSRKTFPVAFSLAWGEVRRGYIFAWSLPRRAGVARICFFAKLHKRPHIKKDLRS